MTMSSELDSPSVLVVLHSAKTSGAELSAVQFMRRWRGLAVRVLLLEDGPIADMLRRCNIPVLVESSSSASISRRRWRLSAVLGLVELLRVGWTVKIGEATPEIIITHSIKTAIIGTILRWRTRAKHVWWVHDRMSREYMGLLGSVIGRAMATTVADGWIVNSMSTLASLPRSRRPVLICPPGVQTERALDGGLRQHERQQVAQLRVGMVGRIAPWKGQAQFLEALALLLGRVDFQASIIGGPIFGEIEYEQSLQRLITERGLSGNVHLLGHRSDVAELLRDLDVLISYSQTAEPFGAVVVEGMAAGCVVIASAEGGPAEVITDDIDGVLVAPRTPGDLADALEHLAKDAARRARLSAAAVATAQIYDYDRLAAAVEQWIASAIGGSLGNYVTSAVARVEEERP